jgi:serine/threonine protein kinase/tetratricopeptide (TPR) repeat protein
MSEPFALFSAALAKRFRVERELGHGGMATVYLAQDLKPDRQVALKVLRLDLAAAVGSERFLREVRITARLNHPHILPLLDSGEADGFVYYAMPYVEGESLRDRLDREKQLPLDDALQIAREVADALSYAHSHDVVHRDIKPENVLLESGHATVADFGIARAITAAGGERLTETGIAVGTPAYMSPEQGAGSGEVDGRSDIYSLGCVLYEMLAGHPPFSGSSAQEVLARHSLDAVPLLTAARPTVPLAIHRAVNTALAKVPADRFRTAAQFAEALARKESAAMPAPSTPVARPSRRPWRLVLLGLAGVAVGAVVLLNLPTHRETPAYESTAIAVLPFENLSAEGPHAYFAGGLHDEILTQLSKLVALKVISRTSVMGYAGPHTPPLRQIASELGVGSVLEGSVQVEGERLRVNVELIDAATDAHLWAERYDRALDDAFGVQSDIAEQIVGAVGLTLGAAERRQLAAAPTTNAEAYRLYLQGHEYSIRPGYLKHNLMIAQELYERALELDPEFALAHAALSQAHGQMYWFRHDPSPGRAARQWAEADTALRLGPDLPQAHVAMGLAHSWGRRDYRRALDEFTIAQHGLPNDAELVQYVGAMHRHLGNWGEAVAAFEKAAQLDPRNAGLLYDLGGFTFLVLHRYAEAVRADNRALSLAPDLYAAAVWKGRAYVLWQGQLDTLRAVLPGVPLDAELAHLGRPAHDVQVLLWERQPDSLLRFLKSARVRVFQGQALFFPASLYAGWAHEIRGDRPAARRALDSALALLDSALREVPNDWRVHTARGLALADLGRREEALREARWMQQSAVHQDAFLGPYLAEDRTRILARVGEADGALDEIEQLLAHPSWLSVHTLRLDPRWDPIRNDPRFQALLVKYANPQPLALDHSLSARSPGAIPRRPPSAEHATAARRDLGREPVASFGERCPVHDNVASWNGATSSRRWGPVATHRSTRGGTVLRKLLRLRTRRLVPRRSQPLLITGYKE